MEGFTISYADIYLHAPLSILVPQPCLSLDLRSSRPECLQRVNLFCPWMEGGKAVVWLHALRRRFTSYTSPNQPSSFQIPPLPGLWRYLTLSYLCAFPKLYWVNPWHLFGSTIPLLAASSYHVFTCCLFPKFCWPSPVCCNPHFHFPCHLGFVSFIFFYFNEFGGGSTYLTFS